VEPESGKRPLGEDLQAPGSVKKHKGVSR
jgi:hypothetical protein